uniref:Uncharacterized protein n=1 Tax=Pipistrellus kuhlii TaxID=59472 RepID=A0A7J7TW40_PIPKU|nr:hypothetical protein mPipKuh1_009278 [Pipistrellus kuhlii]
MVTSWHKGTQSYHLETRELRSEMNKVSLGQLECLLWRRDGAHCTPSPTPPHPCLLLSPPASENPCSGHQQAPVPQDADPTQLLPPLAPERAGSDQGSPHPFPGAVSEMRPYDGSGQKAQGRFSGASGGNPCSESALEKGSLDKAGPGCETTAVSLPG